MSSQDGRGIDDLVSKICKDRLHDKQVKLKCLNFLSDVEIPSGWKDNKSYKLYEHHPTYNYRLQILKNFVEEKVVEGVFVTSKTSKEFFDELKQFLWESYSTSDDDRLWDQKGSAGVDLFLQNVKLEGVVVRKSEKRKKVSVLVKKEGLRTSTAHTTSDFTLSELVVSLENEGQTGDEFHLNMAVGDIVEVKKCWRKEGEGLEPEIVMCHSLSDVEIQSYLNSLSSCVQSDHATAAVIEITRCRAVWNYILNLSKEKYDMHENITMQILETVRKICSSGLMTHTVKEIVQGFQESEFFRTVFPEFIDSVKKEIHFSVVQKVLEHVISVVPVSALQVFPMAARLAHNQIQGSSDLESARDNGNSAIKFLEKLSMIIASKVPGARTDLEVLPWNQVPLIPQAEEIEQPRWKTNDLPVIRKEGQYKSEQEYLETNFRLLREECFHKLRKGISEFVAGQKCDSKDMRMYRITLVGASTHHEESPTLMLMSLKYVGLEMEDSSDLEQTDCFLYGNLLCISTDGSFEEPVWAVVDKHIADQSIVRITLCEKANTMTEPEFIAKMQGITNRGKKAFMAESQTFYLSYAPALEVLQHRDHVPFKEFLIFPDPKHMEPADYISKIKRPPDWGIIFERDTLPESSMEDNDGSADYSLLDDFDSLRMNDHCQSLLDDSQLASVELALRNKVVLIQGPPGTGKSYVGVALVNLLLSMNVPQDHGPILVVTYKNHALDNFMLDCIKKVSSPDVKIVRVGRVADEADDRLKKCLLREAGRYWPEKWYKQKRKLLGQIWALQPKVKAAFEKLRNSSSFTADMFLKEAPTALLKTLLTDTEKITEAELDNLIKERPQTESKLRDMIEKAFNDWLPCQDIFNDVAERLLSERASSSEISSPEKTKEKKKDDHEQENPSDFSDPSAEQKERLLNIDEEIADDDDKEIAKMETKASVYSDISSRCLRSLVYVDKSKLESFKYLLKVSHIGTLNTTDRVLLVYMLQSEFFAKASTEFIKISNDYAQLHHQLQELRNQRDIEVMKECHVIGMTVTGATLRANLLADIKPSVMIVEEAAEILEGQLVAVIPPSVQHLIMIGDHKQLKPIVHFFALRKRHNLDLSMFERLVNCNLPLKQLQYQCRMRDEFVDLLRELKIYQELETNDKLVKGNITPQCVTESMYFWTHTAHEKDSPSSHSKLNYCEAGKISEVAKSLCLKGVPPAKITVLCSYRGQVHEIKKRLKSTEVPALEDITVTTIDSFQGQENDIILISLVRSNPERRIGYLSSMNRLCVAISRARCGLYLFGNHSQFAAASRKGWKVVSDAMRKKGCLGSFFPFSSSEEPDAPRQLESQPFQPEASSPPKNTEPTTINFNISADQAFVNIGRDGSVNTINTNTVPRSSSSRPSRLDVPSSSSGKTPVQDPMTPTVGYRSQSPGGLPTQEAGSGNQEMGGTTKDARDPIQEDGKPGITQLHVEAESPTKEAREPIQVRLSKDEAGQDRVSKATTDEETESPTLEARLSTEDTQPHIQEEESPIKEAKEPIQELSSQDKDARLSTQVTSEGERPFALHKEEDPSDSPIQESANPNSRMEKVAEQMANEDDAIRKATQESEETKVEGDELKFDPDGRTRHVFHKGDLEDLSRVKKRVEEEAIREGEQPFLEQESQETVKGEEGLTDGKPLQESATPGIKDESSKEETIPTQETMAAGKAPFEETGQEGEGKAVQERERPDDPREILGEVSPQVEGGEAQGVSEIKGSESLKPEEEYSKEEAHPMQESMAAGKGPFEETGLVVGLKGHPTQDKE
ncbi:NFX1-type zinc finger-containing protein 1-like [Montipora capricornis]|uniref:NFX1-type zinc finger-containing protein 1-like n=1 Tax=Montipora capricornis TaxID=246305 RepID=UPI0035F182E9